MDIIISPITFSETVHMILVHLFFSHIHDRGEHDPDWFGFIVNQESY